jgi:hypothetical protein
VPLGQVLDDPGVIEQLAEVRHGQHQIQGVLAVGLLDHQEVPAKQFRLALHAGDGLPNPGRVRSVLPPRYRHAPWKGRMRFLTIL